MRLFDPRDLHVGGSGNSNPDAVRPSGETGALDIRPCPEGHDVHVSSREFQGEKIYRVFCPAGIVYQCWRGAEFHFADKAIEHWNATMVALAVVEESAARPLPDFPAGALEDINTTIAELDYIGSMDIDSIENAVKRAKRLLINLRSLALASRFHAPARPAAAGLTDNPLREAVEAFVAWLDSEERGPVYPVGKNRDDPGMEQVWRQWWSDNLNLCDRALQLGRSSLLSSRATGAEVEIVIEEPSEEEISGIARTILENSVMSEMQLMTLAVERGYQLARRHATMRGGGE